MKQVNYILVNDTDCKNTNCNVTYRDVPHLGYCVVCDASCRFKVAGSKERQVLIGELCRLRKHWPETPILGISEVDTSSCHAPVKVSETMNALRREMATRPSSKPSC